eukprot:1947264-Prymnesium_polylepis.1
MTESTRIQKSLLGISALIQNRKKSHRRGTSPPACPPVHSEGLSAPVSISYAKHQPRPYD